MSEGLELYVISLDREGERRLTWVINVSSSVTSVRSQEE
jgi:hypothetical protein